MKRILKLGEKVWIEDDGLNGLRGDGCGQNGWGTIIGIDGDKEKAERPVRDDTPVLVETSDKGLVMVDACIVYQLAPYTFQGDQCCWEHNEMEDDYPLFCPERYENCFFFECDRV